MIAGVDDIPRTSNVRTQQMALWTTAVSLVVLLIANLVSRILTVHVPAAVGRRGCLVLPRSHGLDSFQAW